MADIIVLMVVALIIGGASVYIVRQKKKGVKCIGCPSGTNCAGSCHCNDSLEK